MPQTTMWACFYNTYSRNLAGAIITLQWNTVQGLLNISSGHYFECSSLTSILLNLSDLFLLQFRHKSDNQVNNRQSQVLIRGSWVTLVLSLQLSTQQGCCFLNLASLTLISLYFSICFAVSGYRMKSGWMSEWVISLNWKTTSLWQ